MDDTIEFIDKNLDLLINATYSCFNSIILYDKNVKEFCKTHNIKIPTADDIDNENRNEIESYLFKLLSEIDHQHNESPDSPFLFFMMGTFNIYSEIHMFEDWKDNEIKNTKKWNLKSLTKFSELCKSKIEEIYSCFEFITEDLYPSLDYKSDISQINLLSVKNALKSVNVNLENFGKDISIFKRYLDVIGFKPKQMEEIKDLQDFKDTFFHTENTLFSGIIETFVISSLNDGDFRAFCEAMDIKVPKPENFGRSYIKTFQKFIFNVDVVLKKLNNAVNNSKAVYEAFIGEDNPGYVIGEYEYYEKLVSLFNSLSMIDIANTKLGYNNYLYRCLPMLKENVEIQNKIKELRECNQNRKTKSKDTIDNSISDIYRDIAEYLEQNPILDEQNFKNYYTQLKEQEESQKAATEVEVIKPEQSKVEISEPEPPVQKELTEQDIIEIKKDKFNKFVEVFSKANANRDEIFAEISELLNDVKDDEEIVYFVDVIIPHYIEKMQYDMDYNANYNLNDLLSDYNNGQEVGYEQRKILKKIQPMADKFKAAYKMLLQLKEQGEVDADYILSIYASLVDIKNNISELYNVRTTGSELDRFTKTN